MGLTPTPTSAEVLEKVELCLYSSKGPASPIKRVKPAYCRPECSFDLLAKVFAFRYIFRGCGFNRLAACKPKLQGQFLPSSSGS